MKGANKRQAALLGRVFSGAPIKIRGEDASGATQLTIHGRGGNWELRTIWVGEGWPADVRDVLAQRETGPWADDLVLTARRFSSGSLELLAARGANWADESGNARIESNGLYVIREAATPPEDARPAFSWSPSALAVGEALLARNWPAGVSTTELAGLVHWSPPRVSQVLGAFDRQGWTVKYGPQRGRNARRELSDTESLLQAWANQVAGGERNQRLTHRVLRSPLGFLTGELAEALNEEVRWALGGWAAARELAPISDAVPSLQIYVHEEDFAGPLDRVLRATELKDVAEGGRVAFFPAPASVLSLAQPAANGLIASGPRVYADLLSLGGRAVDVGAHLKEEVLDRIHPPAAKRQAPSGLVEWEQACRNRLHDLVRNRTAGDPYARGSWSASYQLSGLPQASDLRGLMAILREVAGNETGWPTWWAPQVGDNRPRPVDGMIECWRADMLDSEPAFADYWRADPQGRLCLIRPYQEDSEYEIQPQTALDLTLPIRRAGECLLHSKRLARRLDAKEVQLMMRWTGLRGRALATLERGRGLSDAHVASGDEVLSYVQVTPDQIANELPAIVQLLLDPLYESFDFYEPPPEIYADELAALRGSGR